MTSTTTPELRQTPLVDWHRAHGGQLVPFAGFELPVHYGSIVGEHTACRSAAALFDVSHMGRLRFEGPRAGELLDRLLTRPASQLHVGTVRYALVCHPDGGTVDDVLVSRLQPASASESHFLLVVNAANHPRISRLIEQQSVDFPDVVSRDVTSDTAMLAVQGPRAVAIADRLFHGAAGRLKYYRATFAELAGRPVVVSRTGYTGEDGVELIVRAHDAVRLADNLLLAGREHGLQPAGLGARDTLRLEAGMPLYGHELDDQRDPLAAGLGFAVELTPGRTFIGSDALRSIVASGGPSMVRIGLMVDGRRPAREGAPVLSPQGNSLGLVTSGTFAPTLQRPIAMAYVPREFAEPQGRLQVDIRGNLTDATVVDLPFYRRPKDNA
jgi:aminomethyltransferase